jgi:hypothetical protein
MVTTGAAAQEPANTQDTGYLEAAAQFAAALQRLAQGYTRVDSTSTGTPATSYKVQCSNG